MGGFLVTFFVVVTVVASAVVGGIFVTWFPKRRKLLLVYRWGLVCLIVGGGTFAWFSWGPDFLVRYDRPLNYEQAIKEKDIDFPLPASSRNIYYGMYGDWQAYTRLVRFEAPVEDCLKHIDAVIAWNDKMYQRTFLYPRVQVTHVDQVSAGNLNPAPWFYPGGLTRGLYIGESSSHTPEI